jgi:hypothetical protein
MELYNGRLDKTPGAIALRHRWYGTGTPELGKYVRVHLCFSYFCFLYSFIVSLFYCFIVPAVSCYDFVCKTVICILDLYALP